MKTAMERRAKTRFRTVVETLEDEILAGRYKPPASFPSVARIVRRFGVAHLTAVKVLDELKKMGLVHSRQGAGTFVAPTAGRSIGLIVAERLSLGKSMTYRILGDMKKRGLVVQDGHGGVLMRV